MHWPRSMLMGLALLLPAGCGRFGQVDQGRVVDYDRGNGLVTLIRDSNYRAADRPRFDVLPPVVVRIPRNPEEMGPEPAAGKLLAVDSSRREIVTYDAGGRRFRTISYVPLAESRNIRPGEPRLRQHLPLVSREKKTITLYEPRQRLLLTLAASEEHLSLSEDTWKAGDEIRYYYKEPGQALRMMNITQTDIRNAGK